MDGQHQYEITLKKDDLFINLSSDDVYFISKQMDKWFRILLDDSYVPVSLPPYLKAEPQPQPAAQQAAPLPMPEPAPMPQPEVQQPAVQIPQPEPVPQPMPQPQVVPQTIEPAVAVAMPQPLMEAAPMPQPQPAAAQYADVNLPMAQPQPQPQPQPAPPEPAFERQTSIPARPTVIVAPQPSMGDNNPANADFEAVMDSLMKDLEDPDEGALVVPDYAPVSNNRAPMAPVNNGANSIAVEPDLSYVTSLADLCDRSNAGSSEDYLLLSAYYLTRVERQDAFSLKRVNSILVKSGLTPINHSVLETVLTRGYLTMVPDLTGTAEVSEYAITPDGREAAVQLL